MSQANHPFRSVLYIPGSNERALEKAKSLAADAIIFDLEDAVSPSEKDAARATLAEVLAQGGYGNRILLVRINGLDTDWAMADIDAFKDHAIHGILVPKVGSAQDVATVGELAPKLPIWAMVESCVGILNVAEIAAHDRLAGLVMGTNDLQKELGARTVSDRQPLLTSLQVSLLAARAHGKVCVDGVYNAFKDDDGLRTECVQGCDMGFDGKTLIHPAQLAMANEVFAPSVDDVDLARRQIKAHEDAAASGQGVAVVDGRIVENLHIVTAKAMLAKAQAIAELEG